MSLTELKFTGESEFHPLSIFNEFFKVVEMCYHRFNPTTFESLLSIAYIVCSMHVAAKIYNSRHLRCGNVESRQQQDFSLFLFQLMFIFLSYAIFD